MQPASPSQAFCWGAGLRGGPLCPEGSLQPGDTLCPFQPEMPTKAEGEPEEHCPTVSKCPQGVFLGHLQSPKEGWRGGGVARQAVKIRVSDILLLERSGVYSGGEHLVPSNLMKSSVQGLPVHEYKAAADSAMAISWPRPRNAALLLAQNALRCRAISVSLNFYLCSESIPTWEFDIVTYVFICK